MGSGSLMGEVCTVVSSVPTVSRVCWGVGGVEGGVWTAAELIYEDSDSGPLSG